jgi:phosphoribosylglycinamide formyltransferase-1
MSIVMRPCSSSSPLRVAVLASGSGSNLQALLDDVAAGGCSFRVVVVVTNIEGAGAAARALAADVPSVCVPHKGLSRTDHETQVLQTLQAYDVEFVVLAGYMRVVTSTLLHAFPSRVLNVHPALLPSFPGMHGAKQALDHGCRVAGCTVHLVDDGVDTGPILAQGVVPVLFDDDEASLQRRIQTVEHRLLPSVVQAIAVGRVVDVNGRPRLLDADPPI